MTANVIIALGSNTLQSAHIQWASQRLAFELSDVRFSPTLWTPDIHGRGLWYMNRLLWGRTSLPSAHLNALLKSIEQESRRTPQHVTIDLDLMQYNEERYHLSDWQRSYIQKLFSSIS